MSKAFPRLTREAYNRMVDFAIAAGLLLVWATAGAVMTLGLLALMV